MKKITLSLLVLAAFVIIPGIDISAGIEFGIGTLDLPNQH